MKTKRVLLPFLAFNMAISNIAYSETEIAQQTPPQKNIEPEITTQSRLEETAKKLWADTLSAIKTAKIKSTNNIPTADIAKGLNSSGGYGFESSPSLGGKYSGIDVWEVNTNAYPEIFGLSNSTGIGASAGRQFTFIQQFSDRKSSLLRIPYDPMTKLPIKSDLFFKTKFNKETQQNEPIIKDGDFIAFRAPLTLSIGKGSNFSVGPHFSLDATLSWTLAGEFDIHIFKMKNNQVRVKIIALKDDTRGGAIGLNLMGFNRVGQLIMSRLFDTNIFQINFAKTESDLFIADYIFNLNLAESRDMYDQLIGHKMKVLDIEALGIQLKTANPLARDATTQAHLIGDLDRLNDASSDDQEKPLSERRIIRVSNGKNKTNSSNFGMKLNLFRAVKVSNQSTNSISKATVYAQDDHKANDKYILETETKNFSYDWFWLWGSQNVSSTSLLLKADTDFKPTNLLGFQLSRTKEDMTMSLTEFTDIKNAFTKTLPESVANIIQWPDWNFGSKKTVYNVYIQQNLLFTDHLFKANFDVSEKTIKDELLKIIKNYGMFRSYPMNLNPADRNDADNVRYQAYMRKDYINAFAAEWEQLVIPRYLSIVLNSNVTIEERYKAYSYLNKSVPLFSEINGALLLKLIPEKDLKNVIIAKLSMSARNQQTLEAYYPDKVSYETSNVFREITYQTQYILNRSFDLRNFMKEDGTPYSAEEIMLQRTLK
jgi:hypothetical protein